jgi:carboxyl-terminal processing protease
MLKYISRPGWEVNWYKNSQDDINPDGNPFYSKPIVLLVGARTFSAAEDYAAAFKFMNRGKLIGQPTGGSTGQPISFDLPGGGTARICAKRDFYPDGKEFVGIGIIPDIPITPSIKDFENGNDTVRNKALQLLKGSY